MAFPTMQTADVQSGVQTTNSTSWTLTYPTNLASGDLILAFVASDGVQASFTWPSGWISTSNNNGANTLIRAKKLSDGTETGSFSLTLGSSEQGGWRLMRITGWEGTLGGAFQNAADGGSVVATDATGATANPNPPSLNPNNWATEDTLWVVGCSVDTSRTFSAWPASYLPGNNTWDNVSGGAGGASLSTQYRQLNTGSEDPGTFTISTSDDWATATVGIRPAATVAIFHEPLRALQAVNRSSVF